MNTLRYWLKGIRLYIAMASLLVTALTILWARAAYGGSTLYPIRVEEVFAWLALGLVAVAISIGPAYKLFPKLGGKQLLFDARRLLGVSAAWFASWHVGIAYLNLFHAANPLSLPMQYRWSFLAGGFALIILLAMAVTSFDAAFKRMGIWWFRLHRFVYVAIGLALLHAYVSGVHSTGPIALAITTIVSVGLLGAYTYLAFRRQARPTRWQAITLLLMLLFIAAVLTYGFTHQGSK